MEAEGKADVEKQREAAEKLGQEVDELQVHITACNLLSGHQTAYLQTIPDQLLCQCLQAQLLTLSLASTDSPVSFCSV